MGIKEKKQECQYTSRSEEVQDIIERMPTSFGSALALMLVIFFLLLILFGWIVRYPDIVTGSIIINTPVSPVKLIANSSGQLILKSKMSQSPVIKDQPIAIVENGVLYDTVQRLKDILIYYDPKKHQIANILASLPEKISLGELTIKYYDFLNALHQLDNFNNDQIFDKQLASLRLLNAEQQEELVISKKGIDIAKENVAFFNKAYKRDSFLYSSQVSSEAEFDKSQQAMLGSKSAMNNAWGAYIATRKEDQQTKGRIVELNVEKKEKKREIELNIQATYNDLISSINMWEQKYLLKAPFDGYVQFLGFWTDKQFVQSGEPLFTIVPKGVNPYGQVLLPAFGAGKVVLGQEVIVKLNDYPYMEFGYVLGKVISISLTTKIVRIKDTDVESYLVTISFPNGLMTNYGKKLQFKHETSGSAEIIVRDRRLIERLFDNLKYGVKK